MNGLPLFGKKWNPILIVIELNRIVESDAGSNRARALGHVSISVANLAREADFLQHKVMMQHAIMLSSLTCKISIIFAREKSFLPDLICVRARRGRQSGGSCVLNGGSCRPYSATVSGCTSPNDSHALPCATLHDAVGPPSHVLYNIKFPYAAIMLVAIGAETFEMYQNFPLIDEYGILKDSFRLISFAMSLLLAFRLNRTYERWKEARSSLSGVVRAASYRTLSLPLILYHTRYLCLPLICREMVQPPSFFRPRPGSRTPKL